MAIVIYREEREQPDESKEGGGEGNKNSGSVREGLESPWAVSYSQTFLAFKFSYDEKE